MTSADIQVVNALLPEFAGFVFAPGRHHLNPAQGKALRAQLDPKIQSVGVFVHESLDFILQLYELGIINVAQLHGKNDFKLVKALQRAGLPVIQVFQNQKIDFDNPADYFMQDSGQGSGQTLQWRPLPKSKRPIILAGGLTSANVQEAIQITGASIVDVSSGIETNGHKDPIKMSQFCQQAKGVIK